MSSLLATATIAMPKIDYLAIAPELVLLGGAIIVMLAAAMVRGGLRRNVATALTLITGVGSLVVSLLEWHQVTTHGASNTIAHAIAMDGFAAFIGITVSCVVILATLFGHAYLEREGIATSEYHILALASASGAVMMAQANDLIVVFLALEILSIALYVLAAFNPLRGESGEAALKYFLLGGFSSALFVYGIALVYGACGSTNLTQIASFLSLNEITHAGLLDAGLALLLVGFAFKVAAVPFHTWTPDVYQGAPSPVTGFMAAVAKAGAFAGLLRVLYSAFGTQSATWQPIIYSLAVASLILGSLVALQQRDVKRMLAYASINHTGFILIGVEAATVRGLSSSLYYLFAYSIMTVGTFGIISLLGGKGDADHDLARYRGLARRQPLLGGALVVLLLAQAGAPFTTGFLAKFGVVAAGIEAGSWPLALVAMVTAAVSVAFYLRTIVQVVTPVIPDIDDTTVAMPSGAAASTQGANSALLLEDTVETGVLETPTTVAVPVVAGVGIGVAAIVTVFFGVFPGPLLDLARAATLSFFG